MATLSHICGPTWNRGSQGSWIVHWPKKRCQPHANQDFLNLGDCHIRLRKFFKRTFLPAKKECKFNIRDRQVVFLLQATVSAKSASAVCGEHCTFESNTTIAIAFWGCTRKAWNQIQTTWQSPFHCNSMWAHLQDDQLLDGGTLVLLFTNPELLYLGLSCLRFLTTASTF